MSNSKLTTLKKWAPLLTISFSTATFAGGFGDDIKCVDYFSNAEIEFFKPFEKTDYMSLSHYKNGNTEYWGGSGSIAGEGAIDKTKIDVKLTWTYTGSSDTVKVGKLTGEKTAYGWNFVLIPWNAHLGKYDGSKKVTFNNCSDY